jgi:hypothetical protein
MISSITMLNFVSDDDNDDDSDDDVPSGNGNAMEVLVILACCSYSAGAVVACDQDSWC